MLRDLNPVGRGAHLYKNRSTFMGGLDGFGKLGKQDQRGDFEIPLMSKSGNPMYAQGQSAQ